LEVDANGLDCAGLSKKPRVRAALLGPSNIVQATFEAARDRLTPSSKASKAAI
jgi:hypothetical protein